MELERLHVEEPVPVGMLAGLQSMMSPVLGLTVSVRFTVFVNPYWPVIVAMRLPVELPELNEVVTVFMVKGDVALLV